MSPEIEKLEIQEIPSSDRVKRIQEWLSKQGLKDVDPHLFHDYPITFDAFQTGFIMGDSPATEQLYFRLVNRATEDAGLLGLREKSIEMYKLGVQLRGQASSNENNDSNT